jgi:general secretion pathway protein D
MTPIIPHRRLWAALVLSLTLSGAPAVAPAVAQSPPADGEPSVQTTVLPGTGRPPATPVAPLTPARRGDVTVNLQAVDVASAARLVLTDILGLSYTLSPQAKGFVTLRTVTPVRKADLLVMFEDALRSANLGLNRRTSGVYAIEPLSDSRSQAEVITEDQAGYGNETLTLQFVNADQMKRLFDPVIPGAITSADSASNSLVVSGTSRQRKAVRDLVAQFDVNWLRGMSFALYVPQRTDARLIAPELEKLINSPEAPTAGLVRLIAMERLNGILAISAQPQYLEDVRRWVEVLDRAGESAERRLFVYRVQNGRSSDLSATLIRAFGGAAPVGAATGLSASGSTAGQANPEGGALPPAAQSMSSQSMSSQSAGRSGSAQLSLGGESGPVTITSDDQNNAVIVFSAPREFSVIEEALRKLDVPPVQVLIEAAITEVSLNDNLRYGVQWQLGSGGDRVSLTEGKTASATRVFPGFSYLFTNGADIKATLNALNEVTDINVVSAPKLMVLNNQTAVLQVGDEVPVVTASAVSTQTPDAPIVNSVEYRETGVILKVTPRVNGSGSVLLDISQEVSDVAETGTSTINSPTIQQRKIATTVVAQDGQTIALGGLIRDVKTRGKDGVPLLSQIPVVGALFGNHTNSVRRTELLVLLTLRVVRSPVDAEAITAELQAKIQSAAPPVWPRRPSQ